MLARTFIFKSVLYCRNGAPLSWSSDLKQYIIKLTPFTFLALRLHTTTIVPICFPGALTIILAALRFGNIGH